MQTHGTGNLFVVAAPSGTGKTTLVHALIKVLPNVAISISHTTRPKRSSEINHVHYHFVDDDTFQSMVNQQDFLEHATIFGCHYGTSKSWVQQTLSKGKDVILEIDWQGQQQIKRLIPETISIFILPPSRQDLQARLSRRNQDHPEMLQKRLADAREATKHLHEFDYIVVNDYFEQAVTDLTHIVATSRLSEKNQSIKLTLLINELLA